MAEATRQAPALFHPVLLLCGAEDRIVSVVAAQAWLARVAGPARTKVFPGCYHELHHEPVFDQVVTGVRDWVLPDLGQGGGT
jgi:alpha-beta hydrolase superfamily lysophospholipase